MLKKPKKTKQNRKPPQKHKSFTLRTVLQSLWHLWWGKRIKIWMKLNSFTEHRNYDDWCCTMVPRQHTIQEAKHSWTCVKETGVHGHSLPCPLKMGPDKEGVGRADLTVISQLKAEGRLACGFLLPESQKPSGPGREWDKGVQLRLTEPSHHLPASPRVPGSMEMPYITPAQAFSVSQCTHLPTHSCQRLWFNQVTKARRRWTFSFGCLHSSLLMVWLMFFNMIFFMRSGCLWEMVTGISRALVRAPSHLLGAP